MSHDETKPKTRDFMRALPLAGVMCLLGAFGWAIAERIFHGGAIALGSLGILMFLTAFIRVELANVRSYINVAFYVAFVLGICTVIYLEVRQRNRQFDLTSQKIHTISEATEKYLELLKKEVRVVVFDVDSKPYEDLLNRYASVTSRMTWSLHDPRSNPEFTRQFDPNVSDGMIYIVHGEKKKRISLGEFDENTMTNAMVEVTREGQIKVYFLTGHGELAYQRGAAPSAPTGASIQNFRNFLASRAMMTEPLDLLERGFVPEDASLLIIAGPTRDISDVERRHLERYLASGGKALVFFDLPTTGRSVDFENLAALLRRHGIDDNELILVDANGQRLYGSPFKIPIAAFNESHTITKIMNRSAASIALNMVRCLRAMTPPPDGHMITALVASSADSWTVPYTRIMELAASADAKFTPPSRDDMEARALGWAVESEGEAGAVMRLVVYGASELVRDGQIEKNQTAAVLLLNTVNWLVEQGDLIDVVPRVIAGTPLILSNAELQLILIVLVMAFPSILFFGGVGYVQRIWRS